MAMKLKKVFPLGGSEAFTKIMGWFYSFPNKEFSLTDLSHQLNIAKTTANRIVTNLVKSGILNKGVIGKIWRLSLNITNPYNIRRKIAYNLAMIYKSRVIDEILQVIDNSHSIILFGSYRKGDDDENSDIDIAVEVLGDEDLKIVQLGVLPQFGYRKNVAINLHIFSRNKIDLNLFANIANGIILDGFLEVRL